MILNLSNIVNKFSLKNVHYETMSFFQPEKCPLHLNFIQVCTLEELPNNSQKVVNIGKRKIALFHYNEKISAIANACLHKAGPLGLGEVAAKYDGLYVTSKASLGAQHQQ